MYNIKDLEKLSGIKAHTLRIWEKRYNVLLPHRTKTNIRYYDDNQLVHLLNIKTLISNKWKISKISKLSKEELNREVDKAASNYRKTQFESQINELINHTLSYNEERFEYIIETAFEVIGVEKTVTEIIYCFLHRIGVMWQIGDIIPVHEHFASNLIRQKLLGAIDRLRPKITKEESFLLFLPENEYHEIGLLLCQYILRKEGYKTYYFGSNVPMENAIEGVKAFMPDNLFVFVVTRQSKENLISYISKLSQSFQGKKMFVAGKQFENILTELPQKVTYLETALDLKRELSGENLPM